MDLRFYRCEHCGNIVVKVKNSGVPVICCGQPMTELVPGVSDGAYEKHVPVVSQEGNIVTVKVGSVDHPMLPEHFITFVAIAVGESFQVKFLNPGEKPEAVFALTDGQKPSAVYEYCNLHGLWKAE